MATHLPGPSPLPQQPAGPSSPHPPAPSTTVSLPCPRPVAKARLSETAWVSMTTSDLHRRDTRTPRTQSTLAPGRRSRAVLLGPTWAGHPSTVSPAFHRQRAWLGTIPRDGEPGPGGSLSHGAEGRDLSGCAGVLEAWGLQARTKVSQSSGFPAWEAGGICEFVMPHPAWLGPGASQTQGDSAERLGGQSGEREGLPQWDPGSFPPLCS